MLILAAVRRPRSCRQALDSVFLPLFLRYFCSSAVALRHTVNAYRLRIILLPFMP